MTTASDGVAVIATQLAQTDRRALSEAWFSALHLARSAPPQSSRGAKAQAIEPRGETPLAARSRDAGSGRAVPLTVVRARRASADVAVVAVPERRRPVTETARRIERVVARLAWMPSVPAAHTIDVDGGRVRVIVHNDGRTARIVALCSSPLRETVERALASARFALAGTGVAVGAP